MEKCLDTLEPIADPVVVIPKEMLCIIEIINCNNQKVNGLGCYYGYGYVLTALHVIEKAGPGEHKIGVTFTSGKSTVFYNAVYNQSCNFDKDKDQAFIKLLSDTRLLCDGLQNQIGKVGETVYFYTLTNNGNFKQLEGKICRPTKDMKAEMCTEEYVISVAGKFGDSGSPVYNANNELIGIYRGSFTCINSPEVEYGRFTKISPHFIPWRQKNSFFYHLYLYFLQKFHRILSYITEPECCT